MTQTYKNYIGGEWRDASDGATFASRNPANTQDVIGNFPESAHEDVNRAVAAAREAYKTWRLVPAPKRAEILFRAAEKMARRKDELTRAMTREMGKVTAEAGGDVQEGIDMFYYVAGEGRRLYGETTPSELPDKFAMSVRAPLGVCALITPWNFPMAIPTWKIGPALVAGNTVVFKPAEDTPHTAHLLVEILIESGVPAGVLNLVHGKGEVVGAALVEHPGVDMISFTGSTETGQLVALAGAQTYKRVSLEMGGKNAIVVLDDADLKLAADGAVWGAFGTSGQRCTASSRLIVHEKVVGEFSRLLVERARAMRLGDGLDPSTDVGPVINAAQLERIHGYTEIGKAEGAKLLCGGEIAREGALSGGHFYRPTVFGGVSPAMRIAREEIFGPTTAILPVKSLDEAIEIVNGVDYGLSSSIYTANVNNAFRAMRDLETGIVYVNASTIGAEVHLPFGGVRRTGNGHREGGHSLDAFTEWKALYIDYSGILQRAQIDNAE